MPENPASGLSRGSSTPRAPAGAGERVPDAATMALAPAPGKPGAWERALWHVKRVTKRPGQPPGHRGTGRKEWTKKTSLTSGDVPAARAGRCPLKDKKCPWQILGEILKGSQHGDQSPFSIPCLEGLPSTAEGHIWGGATESDGARRRTRLRDTSRGAGHPDSGVPGLWVSAPRLQ